MKFRHWIALAISALVGVLLVTAPAGAASRSFGFYDACGQQPLKPDGTRWQCTFVDNFSGSALDRTKWIPQTNFETGTDPGMHACAVDSPANVSVSNGALHLSLISQAQAVSCGGSPTNFTSGMVSSYHLFSQQYGRFEARVRTTATTAPGLQESFWLWPDDRYTAINWPLTGEIDVAETYSQYGTVAIPFLHYTANDNGGPVPGLNTAWNCAAQRGVWNTYDLTWTSTSLTIAINGTTCLVNTSADPAFNEPYILAFTQALGSGSNAATGSTPVPATMDVDYVKVWK